MESFSDLNGVPAPEYCGYILSGDFSVELKKRVAEYIDRYRSFEDTGSAAILYIAAWQGEKEKIWYEYASQKFMNLLGCENSEVAEIFRDSIIDRRIYKGLDVDVGIRKEVKNRDELNCAREALREEGKKAGTIEAVYKLAVNSSGAVWLKDQAAVEIYAQDGICLSLGFLTVVSKEMEAEDELKKHHDRLEEVVLERTAELTILNEQLKQEISERKLAEEKLHHEKMDRSGYPQGLAGEDILLEARILCVADVVESIESHRPYRPGLGIDKALEEISKNRGILFDPDVVDACLRLFKEKNFQY